MQYHTIPPAPSISQFVRFHWFLESDRPYTHHAMADVCPELLFHYNGQFREVMEDGREELSFLSGISAPTSRTRIFRIDRGFGMFGTYLYPHVLPLLFGLPVHEMTDQMIDLENIARPSFRELEDKIMNSRSRTEMVRQVEEFILQRLQKKEVPPPPVFGALQYILSTKETPKVSTLANDFFLSERQLERQFKKFTGFSPKQFIRIARFHRAMKYYGQSGIKLGEIALDCGYYDQSHFVHDFRQFSGLNPSTYFSGTSSATDWKD